MSDDSDEIGPPEDGHGPDDEDMPEPEDEGLAEVEHTHLPPADARVELRGYRLKLDFHPPIRLDKKRGHAFAAELCELLGLEKNKFESHKWEFLEPLSGGSGDSFFEVTICPDDVTLEVRLPPQNREWIENRFSFVLDHFYRAFKPRFLLGSSAGVQGTMPIDGDARTFLAHHVMNMQPDRVDPFRRPIHLLGLRFVFPPFVRKGKDGKKEVTEWTGEARVESLIEDPSKLFLAVEGEWPEVKPWKEDTTQNTIRHLDSILHYLEKCVKRFVQEPPASEDGPGEEG